MAKLDAVIFDIGGVLTQSPVTRITRFAAEHGISDETRMAIFSHGESPWSRFERSELDPPGFAAEFDRHSEPGWTTDGAGFLKMFFEGFPRGPRCWP